MAGSFKARDVMERAGIVLSDAAGARWTFPELALWISDGLREIATLKPTATAKNVVLNLQTGTFQQLQQNVDGSDPVALVRAIRNVAGETGPRVGGRVVGNVSRVDMDAINPYWHDASEFPATKEVSEVVYDPTDPLTYYVFPGNIGTGFIEALVGFVPAKVPDSLTPNSRDSYDGAIDLNLIYLNPLLDYVLYRCFGKEAEHASSGPRAVAHYQAMANSLGVKVQNERMYAASRALAEKAA